MASLIVPITALIALLAALFVYVFVFADDFDPASVRGKRIVVTGSSAGIGEELAYEYSKLGAQIIVTARTEKRLQEVVKKCLQLGAKKAAYVVADLAKSEDRAKLIRQVEAQLGGLDHLVLNHIQYEFGPWTGSDENVAAFRRDLDGHFLSYVDIASRALKLLTASRGQLGIVNSIAGKVSFTNATMYSANKFALDGFFSALRQELIERGAGVSVTSFVLGPIAVQYNGRSDFAYTYFLMRPADVTKTAFVILKGMSTRAHEVYYPLSALIAAWLHKFFPRYVEDYSSHAFGAPIREWLDSGPTV